MPLVIEVRVFYTSVTTVRAVQRIRNHVHNKKQQKLKTTHSTTSALTRTCCRSILPTPLTYVVLLTEDAVMSTTGLKLMSLQNFQGPLRAHGPHQMTETKTRINQLLTLRHRAMNSNQQTK